MSDDDRATDRFLDYIGEFMDEPPPKGAPAPPAEAVDEEATAFETSFPDPETEEVSTHVSHPDPACKSDGPKARKIPTGVVWIAGGAGTALVAVIALVVWFASGDGGSAPVAATTTTTSSKSFVPLGHAPRTSTSSTEGDQQLSGITLDGQRAAGGAGASGCPEGSTPASFATDGDSTHAFICLRNGSIGQVFYIHLGGTYKVGSVCFVPGALGVGQNGKPAFWDHRVITRFRLVFPNPLMPDNAEAARVADGAPPSVPKSYCVTVSPPALATTITLQILETAALAQPEEQTDTPDETTTPGGIFGNLPTATSEEGSGALNVSDSIALSLLTVQGHSPQ